MGGLRADAGSVRDPNRMGKFVIDITGETTRPPKISRGGPLCSWGLPRAGGITSRVSPLILTCPNPKLQQVTQFHLALKEMQRPRTVKGEKKEENMANMKCLSY